MSQGAAATAEQKLCATRCPLPPAAEERIHVLPCRVKYDGKAPISSYFVVDVDANLARYRGVELKGATVDIDELGYAGLVMVDDGLRDENENAFSEQPPGIVWELEGHFATLVDWQTRDNLSHDPLAQRLEGWTRYAAAIHDDE
ncbi:Aste57867_8116 [Aphanomyces stellatus]|uniref:Aste57867_8116 protein n=1 Tax=Aphanomyces stellatus TaxID=120398 RepID=A0A485KJE5_9STRA|nr:hypothetical protein As57867_008086 [Aphanomyces stellatus]VFT85005.1 Aste57867_8116 [Aphanomyces stellatus]